MRKGKDEFRLGGLGNLEEEMRRRLNLEGGEGLGRELRLVR